MIYEEGCMKRRKHNSKEEPEHPQQEMDVELRQQDYDKILDNAIRSSSQAIMRKRKRKKQEDMPQLSSAEHELIFDSALDQSKVMKPKQNKTVNPTLKQYLSTNKVLIQYVKDINGYPKGLVVAISKEKIGWSLVSTRDISLQRIDPMNIPVLKKLIEKKSPIADLVKHKAYQKCIRDHSSVTVPTFDKNTGLFIALGRSLISKQEERDGKLVLEPAPANDAELRAAISKMVVRSRKYFK
jgi:hypothetical protein